LADGYQPSEILSACLSENQQTSAGEKVVLNENLRKISCIHVMQRMILIPEEANIITNKENINEKDKIMLAASELTTGANKNSNPSGQTPSIETKLTNTLDNNGLFEFAKSESEQEMPNYMHRILILTAHYDSSVRVWSENVGKNYFINCFSINSNGLAR
jgi:hypothetical protein